MMPDHISDHALARLPLTDNAAMLDLLALWVEHNWLRGLDAAFARFLWQEIPDADPLLILAAALASHQLGRGHACLDLAATLDNPSFSLSLPPEGRRLTDGGTGQDLPLISPAELLADVNLAQWDLALKHPDLVSTGAGNTPLVFQGSRMYLRRYWQYEQDVGGAIQQRIGSPLLRTQHSALARQFLDALFPDTSETTPDWQKLACALAVRSSFSIITGGPGTGKTTTVVMLLALLQALALQDIGGPTAGRPLRIRLAAPTGKAAARLNESIGDKVADLPLQSFAQAEKIRSSIPLEVSTLHRLLGSVPDSRRFRHHAGNPLALDVLVIDEASMVDLEMMAAVMAALPPNASVILLGDKDQLASVEAGAVLGQLCYRAAQGHYTPDTVDWLKQTTGFSIPAALQDQQGSPLDQAVVMLRHSHRFSGDSGIGKLAQAVNLGDGQAMTDIWVQGYPDLSLLNIQASDTRVFTHLVINGVAHHDSRDTNSLSDTVHYGYRHYLCSIRDGRPSLDAPASEFNSWAQHVLHARDQFQVLCALRSGAWGVDGLNLRIAQVLHQEGLISATDGWYSGRPVLVIRNDYSLGLMNGDMGVALEVPTPDGSGWTLRVAFTSLKGDQRIKWVLPSRLQAVDTVYALTVHKSQGSEFTHTVLMLPDTMAPILTRELVYTGVTRARKRFTLVNSGPHAVLTQAVQRRILRVSGLIDQVNPRSAALLGS